MARHGLKQIGEHMHVVTRTMSAFTEQEASGKIETMKYFITKFIFVFLSIRIQNEILFYRECTYVDPKASTQEAFGGLALNC